MYKRRYQDVVCHLNVIPPLRKEREDYHEFVSDTDGAQAPFRGTQPIEKYVSNLLQTHKKALLHVADQARYR